MFARALAPAALILTLLPLTFSQSWFWILPICQQLCLVRMLNQDADLGCPRPVDDIPDVVCLCNSANATNFYYGIRDCVLQSCGSPWSYGYNIAHQQLCGKCGIT